ncbi:hypothetical protein BSKO_11825 [Bryopsis sp. KO-2023]|nr:hypothetical protein BSKO_11825 [Bryopsis sp. KO-2023]
MNSFHGTYGKSCPLVGSSVRTFLVNPLRRSLIRQSSGTKLRLRSAGGFSSRNSRALVVTSSSRNDREKEGNPRYRKTLLNVLDGASLLGTVGGAVAVLLGADIMIIAFPVVLPFVSLAIGRSKEKARVAELIKAEQDVRLELRSQRELVTNTQESVLDVGEDLNKKLSKRLVKLEEKVGAMEGTIITTGKNVRQLVSGLKSMPKMLRKMAELQQQAVMYGISGELKAILERYGSAQLQEIDAIGTRLRYLEDAVQRLEFTTREEPAQVISDEPSYRYGGRIVPVEPIPLEDSEEAAPFLKQAKETVTREVSGVLEDLKTTQADMLRSLQDLSFNQPYSERAPDFSLLEGQLTNLASQLGTLPSKMSDGVRQELGMLGDYKADVSLQLSSVSRALGTLERVVLEMKENSADRGTREIIFENTGGESEGGVDPRSEVQFDELRAGVSSISEELKSVKDALDGFKKDFAQISSTQAVSVMERVVDAESTPVDSTPEASDPATREGKEVPSVSPKTPGVSTTQPETSQRDGQVQTDAAFIEAPGDVTSKDAQPGNDIPDITSTTPEPPIRDYQKGPTSRGVSSSQSPPTVLEFLPPEEDSSTPPPLQPSSPPPISAMPGYSRYTSQPSPSPSNSTANYTPAPPSPQPQSGYERFDQGGPQDNVPGKSEYQQDPYEERAGFDYTSGTAPQPDSNSGLGVFRNDGGVQSQGFGSPIPDDGSRWEGGVNDPSFAPSWSTITDPMGLYGESATSAYPLSSPDPRADFREPVQGGTRDFVRPEERNYQGDYMGSRESYAPREPQGNRGNDYINDGERVPSSGYYDREEVSGGVESQRGGYDYSAPIPGMEAVFPGGGAAWMESDDGDVDEEGGGSQKVGALAKVGNSEGPDLLVEGLQLLKDGRKAVDTDFGDAYRLLCEALDCFESKLGEDPGNVKALGNCGNALLALGELKVQMVESLLEVDAGPERSRNSQALTQLREEAQQFLTLSGQKFKKVLERFPSDERGYMNWAKALNIRATLTSDPVMKDRLFNAAAVKYEQVLSMRSNFPAGMLAYASVLKDWASSKPARDINAVELMQQAIACLEDLLRTPCSDSLKEEASYSKQEFEQILKNMSEIR